MILGVYKYPLGVTFEEKSRKSGRNPVFTIESCVRENSFNSCDFFLYFQYNFSPPTVDIGTLTEPH